MINKFSFLLKPYISILFLRDIKAAFILFFLSFLLPSVGILGLVALITTVLFAEFISLRDEYLKYGFYLYNSLLVGMGVGYYFDVSFLTIVLTSMLSISTFLLSFGLNRAFLMFGLPILSFPFAFVSMFFYLASLKYNTLLTNLLHREPIIDVKIASEFLTAFFKSMGTIIFLPYTLSGIVISLIILFYSRILFFLAFIGFSIGVFAHSLFIPFEVSLNSHYNFNYSLIAMALGGVFLIPNIKNYTLAFIAVILSVVLIDAMEVFFNLYALPVYTLPFNVMVIIMILLLYGVGYKYVNYNIKGTPERSLNYFLSNFYRFGGSDIKIHLPFIGKWSVYQAFDGKWTHKGSFKYAYDFVVRRNGKTYKNDGLFVEDYYAFGESVVAPINGYIVSLRSDLADNFIGSVDRENNWGNHIIIKSDYGYYVLIAHLMQHSISVNIGDYVQVGQIIGKCGNSGYSPEPHIHIQVQKYGVLGSETLPFKFFDYLQDGILYFYKNPREDEEIEAPILDKSMKLRLNFILDDVYKYEVLKDDKKIDEVEFKVNMNDKGEFYLSDGKNRLYFYMYDKLFYFYEYDGVKGSYLEKLFKLAPRLPLINKNIKYFDILPLEIRYNLFSYLVMEFLLSFNYKLFDKKEEYVKDELEYKSKYGKVVFSFYEKGFDKIKFNGITLRRIYEKNNTFS